MTFSDCKQHFSHGTSETEAGCQFMARAADTNHAMHHARLNQRASRVHKIYHPPTSK
jgi:hypothetical protein